MRAGIAEKPRKRGEILEWNQIEGQKARDDNTGGTVEGWRAKQVVTHCVWWRKTKPYPKIGPWWVLASFILASGFWLLLTVWRYRETVGEGLLCTGSGNKRNTVVKKIIILMIHMNKNHGNHANDGKSVFSHIHLYIK